MTDVEKSKIHPHVDNFKFLHMTDVDKSEISFIMCTMNGILLHFKLFCYKIRSVLSQNWFVSVEKNDKYQV